MHWDWQNYVILRTALLNNYEKWYHYSIRVFSVLIKTLETIWYYLTLFHLRVTSGMRWLSLQFSKHCSIHWLQIHWNQFSVLNSNFAVSVILSFVNNTAISGGAIVFDKRSRMTINFECTTEVTSSRTMLSFWWCNFCNPRAHCQVHQWGVYCAHVPFRPS